mmetsp:Transcript_39636/g.93379  ORF Transcript_39636/g.93379 Transcript_39636/m.93379 type:complete len:149 (+) Transcript_39636:69-515(+)
MADEWPRQYSPDSDASMWTEEEWNEWVMMRAGQLQEEFAKDWAVEEENEKEPAAACAAAAAAAAEKPKTKAAVPLPETPPMLIIKHINDKAQAHVPQTPVPQTPVMCPQTPPVVHLSEIAQELARLGARMEELERLMAALVRAISGKL